MSKLNDFLDVLVGHFDNTEQMKQLETKGVTDFPFSRHVNTICNDKIMNMPENFAGVFMVEESYYTAKGNTHSSPHIFLFEEEENGVRLTSYEIPEGYQKSDFTYEKLGNIEYECLKKSEKFTPALYILKDNVWEGGSVSMFSPVLKFTLFERFSGEQLEVSESMEVNGNRTFGYDEPIIYKRAKQA